jgi:ribose transport system substrate-binding protein
LGRRITTLGRAVCIAAGIGAVALAGCGNKSDDESEAASASDTAAADSQELHATVLDKQIEASEEALPALTVKTNGGPDVSFDEGEQLKILFSGFGKGFDYTVPQYAAAEDVAKEYGLEVDSFDPAGDPQKQVNQIRDAMASGKYNAAIVYPLAANLDCNLLSKQLPEDGILVATIGQTACIGKDEIPGIVSAVPDTLGTVEVWESFFEYITEHSEGPQKAIVLYGTRADLASQLATQATDSSLGDPVEVVDKVYTDYTQPDALQKVQDALQSHPDLTMIISAFPEGTQGALTAIKQAGAEDRVTVYDMGANHQGLEAVKSGALKMASPNYPYTKVRAAMQALVLARRGQTVPQHLPYAGHAIESMRPEGADIMFVTQDNVDDFERLVAEY